MSEFLLLVVLALVGALLLAPVWGRIPRVATAALAFPMGASGYMFSALALLVVTGTVRPAVALVSTLVAGSVGLALGVWRRQPGRSDLIMVLAVAGAGALVAAVAWNVHMTRLTPDSLRYLLGASDYQLPNAASAVHAADLMARQFGLQALQSLAALSPRAYIASFGPAFGVSAMVLLGWVLWSRLPGSRVSRGFVVCTGVTFLLASNRLLYDFFYINTHIATATFLFAAIAGAWLAVVEDDAVWAYPAGVALAATLLLRPEAPLVAALVLVPVAASRAGWPVRFLMTAPSVLVMGLWYGLVLWRHYPGGNAVSLSAPVFGNLMVSTLAIAGVLLAGTRIAPRLVRWIGIGFTPVLLAVLGLYIVSDPSLFARSMRATIENLLGAGFWGFTWPMTLVLLLGALFLHRLLEVRLWTTPIFGFLVLVLLLPHVRGGAYRIGAGDSGNRILAHILIATVAFIVLAACSRDATSNEALPKN